MTTGTTEAHELEPGSAHRLTEGLLIVTDQDNGGRAGLILPFDDATLVQLEPGEPLSLAGEFDKAFVDLQRIDRVVIESVVARLRPDSELTLMLPRLATLSFDADDLPCDRLAWTGFNAKDGRLCLVLRLITEGESGIGEAMRSYLDAAVQAYDLGTQSSAEAVAGLQARADHLEASLAELADIRRSSEQALVGQLETVLRELDTERRHPFKRHLKAALKRRRLGRAALWVLRPAVRAARMMRRRQRSGGAGVRRVVVRTRT